MVLGRRFHVHCSEWFLTPIVLHFKGIDERTYCLLLKWKTGRSSHNNCKLSNQWQLQLKYWWSDPFEPWNKKTPAYQHIQRGATWFRYRVSIHHPLGFNWHPFESAGIWGWKLASSVGILGIIMNHYFWIPTNPPGFKDFLTWQIPYRKSR